MPSPSPLSIKQKTIGHTARIDCGQAGVHDFVAGKPHRALIEEVIAGRGVVLTSGLIRLADGTEVYAVLEIDECSSGEHCGTGVFTEGGFFWLNKPEALAALGKIREDVYPYKYRYTAPLEILGSDFHIGDDGWSR